MGDECVYLKGHKCLKPTKRDELDCLMCLHSQMVIYQQHIMNLIESANVSLKLARNLMKTQEALVQVNAGFEDIIIKLHPAISERREEHMAHFNENPLVT